MQGAQEMTGLETSSLSSVRPLLGQGRPRWVHLWGQTVISTTALLTGHGDGHTDPEGLATHPQLRTFGGGLLKGQAPPRGLTEAWGRTLEG